MSPPDRIWMRSNGYNVWWLCTTGDCGAVAFVRADLVPAPVSREAVDEIVREARNDAVCGFEGAAAFTDRIMALMGETK